jgi:hypothetical protein
LDFGHFYSKSVRLSSHFSGKFGDLGVLFLKREGAKDAKGAFYCWGKNGNLGGLGVLAVRFLLNREGAKNAKRVFIVGLF